MSRQTVGGDIVYSEQIIRNVALKMGIEEGKVKHVFNFIFPHLKMLSKKPDVFSLPLMGLGRIYMCTEKWKKVLLSREQYQRVSSRQRENHRKLKTKIDKMEQIFADESKGGFMYSYHKKRASISSYFYTQKKTLQELEEIQNEESRKVDKKEQNNY